MTDQQDHPFDQAIHLAGEQNNYLGHTSEAYANMFGPFGGVTAATLLKAATDHPECQGEPITLTVNFAAPIKNGGFDIQTQLIRTNRSTQHWFLTLSQEGKVATTATVVFAKRRQTWSETEAQFPTTPTLEEGDRVFMEGMPRWVKSYDLRMPGGNSSFLSSEAPTSVTIQSIRDDPPRPLDFFSLTAICDAFFPRIFTRRPRLVPIGTVSLVIYFHVDAATLSEQGDKALLGQAHANHFGNNYFDQSGEVWAPSGELLATTHQIVYFKE